MAVTKDHPLGEPTPAGRMQDALAVADDMARRIQKLRDKLIGAPRKDEDGAVGQIEVSFFGMRDGRMNALASKADLFMNEAQRATNAIDEIEDALDVHDAMPKSSYQPGEGVGIGSMAARQIPRHT